MKFHEELNPKLWEDNELKEEVADKLLQIAEAFIDYADIPEDSIKDIVITGSSANYNYTLYSDLDLHLVIDYNALHEGCPLVEGYLWNCKSNFNKEHDIFIYGIPVELYAENMDTPAVSNGIYSVMNNKWKKEPEQLEPTDNDTAVEAKVNEYKEIIDKEPSAEEAEEILDKLYIMRKAGLSEEGEFSTENLTFKKLRDLGYLQKLRELKKEQVDKELSLENKIIQKGSSMDFDLVLFDPDNSYEYFKEALETKDEEEVKEYAEDNGYEEIFYYKKDNEGDFIIYEVYGEGIAVDTIEKFNQVVGNMGMQYPSIAKLKEQYKDNLPELIKALNENEDWLGEWEANIIYGIYKEIV